jgi:hypothetical protein
VPSSIFEQRESESAWRQLLVQGVLVVLLPTEDLENACLRSLVAEIFAEMILGNGISGKTCEGWLLWEGITKIAEALQTDHAKEMDIQSDDPTAERPLSRLQRYGLLASSADQQSDDETSQPPLASVGFHEKAPMTITGLFWDMVQYVFLTVTALRAVIVAVTMSSTLPPRSVTGSVSQSPVEGNPQSQLLQANSRKSRRRTDVKRPIISMRLWSCASELFELGLRMPWLTGAISMLHWGSLVGVGRVGDTDGVLDR